MLSHIVLVFFCSSLFLSLLGLIDIQTVLAQETTPPEEVSASCINQPVPLEAYVNPDYFYTRYKSSMSYQIPVEETGCTPGDPYSSCPTITGSAIGDDYNWECNVPAHVDIVDDDTIIQRSGGSFTYEFHKGDTISIYQDTVWGGVDCADGKKAMYRINPTSDPSQRGGGVWRQQMACGEVFSTEPQKLVTYYYDPAIDEPGNEEMPLTQCYLPPYDQLTLSGTTQMVYEGPALCCDKEINAAVVRSVTGPGAGETFVYCLGYGLCAHYERINFSLHDPSEWGLDTDLCRLETNKADYYLYPIKGVLSNNPEEFKSDLVAQGYEAYCTTPKINIHGEVSMEEYVKQLLKANMVDITMDVHSEQKFDYNKSEFPLFRNNQDPPTLFNSLETYWGFLAHEMDLEELTKNISTSQIYHTLTLEQQCQKVISMLTATENMCLKLEEPDTCALDTDIEGTKFSTINLLQAFRSDTDLNCKRVGERDFFDEEGRLIDLEGKKIADAISKTPIFVPKAYRIGFLVVVADLFGPPVHPYFNFMRLPDSNANPQHEVRILAFKIPDVATNKDRNSDIYYDDAIQLTRDNFRDPIDFEKMVERENELKSSFTLPGSPGNIIECTESRFCQENPFVMALVDFVNNRLQNTTTCSANSKDLPFEETDTITESGGFVKDTPGAKFNYNNEVGDIQEKLKQEKIVQKLGNTSSTTNQEEIETKEDRDQETTSGNLSFRFLSQIKPLNEPQKTDTSIRSFLIIPQGIELEEIEKSIAGFLYSPKEIDIIFNTPYDQFEEDSDYKNTQFLKLNNTGQSFPEAKQERRTGIYDEECVLRIQSTSQEPNPDISECEEKITASITSLDDNGQQDDAQLDREPRVFGGRLGFLTRKMQQSLHRIGSNAYNYIRSCKTTEDFLLGRCDATLKDYGRDNDQDDQVDGEHYCIDWKMERMNETEKQQLKANITEFMTTNYKVINFEFSPERGWDDGYQFLQSTNPDVWVEDSELTNYFENWVNGGRSKLFFKMPTSIDQCEGDVCWRYIMNRCFNEGFNPALCIAMNLSETAGSNTRYDNNADFGCMIESTWSNVSANLGCLINNFFKQPHVFPKNFTGMWEQFAGLDTASGSYPKVKQYYTELSGGIGITQGLCSQNE